MKPSLYIVTAFYVLLALLLSQSIANGTNAAGIDYGDCQKYSDQIAVKGCLVECKHKATGELSYRHIGECNEKIRF